MQTCLPWKWKPASNAVWPKIGRSHSMNFSFRYVGNKSMTEPYLVHPNIPLWILGGAGWKSRNYDIRMGEILIFPKNWWNLNSATKKMIYSHSLSQWDVTDFQKIIKISISHDFESIENSYHCIRFLKGYTPYIERSNLDWTIRNYFQLVNWMHDCFLWSNGKICSRKCH